MVHESKQNYNVGPIDEKFSQFDLNIKSNDILSRTGFLEQFNEHKDNP